MHSSDVAEILDISSADFNGARGMIARQLKSLDSMYCSRIGKLGIHFNKNSPLPLPQYILFAQILFHHIRMSNFQKRQA